MKCLSSRVVCAGICTKLGSNIGEFGWGIGLGLSIRPSVETFPVCP